MTRVLPPARTNAPQTGIALITVLVLLVVVTLLALSAGRNATQGELFARANRARQVSLQAAEAALVDAREMLTINSDLNSKLDAIQINNNSIFNTAANNPGLFRYNGQAVWNATATQWIPRGTWTRKGGGTTTPLAAGGASGVSSQPSFIVEYIATSLDPEAKADDVYYRVTARGIGPNANVVTLIQETVVRQAAGHTNPIPE